MLSATAWVPRGFPSENPIKYELDEEEMGRISELAKLQLEDAKEELEDAEKKVNKIKDESEDEIDQDEELKEYDMANYDKSDNDEDDEDGGPGKGMGMFGNIKSLAYHQPGEKDPYITLDNAEQDDEEERQELQIRPTDNLVLAAKTEDDVSFMEVYVYDDTPEVEENGAKNDLYVHHDFMLPSFPLCVEWLDYRVGKAKEEGDADQPGSFAAIGTFEPEIEIWNLDVVDSAFPDLILGQRPENAQQTGESGVKMSKKKKKKSLSKRLNDEYHIDAVLSLSANRSHRNLLVSGSADTTVKLWDLNNGTCAKSFQFHDGKVSSVNWSPTEGTVLLSGGYDAQAIVSDLRTEDKSGQLKWKVDGDVEGVRWSPNGQNFYVSTENGRIHKFDARTPGSSVWTLQAHDSEVTSFDINPFIEDYMVTGSTDRTVKLWNLSSPSNKGGPSMILSRDLDVGKVFSVGFAPDKEVFGHIVAAGSGGEVKVWDTMTNRTVREGMGKKKLQTFADGKEDKEEKIIGLPADEEEDDDDENEESDDDGSDEASEEDEV